MINLLTIYLHSFLCQFLICGYPKEKIYRFIIYYNIKQKKRLPGIWTWIDGSPVFETEINAVASNGEENYCDRISNSQWGHGINLTGYPTIWKAFEFTLPKITDEITFSNAYLLIKMQSICTSSHDCSNWLTIATKRVIGGVNKIIETDQNTSKTIKLDNIPDFYYTNVIDTKK